MTPRDALEEIRTELVQAFGDALATKIVHAAAGGPPQAEMDAVTYRAALASICKDERVVGMFGELGMNDRQQRWERLA